MEYLDVLLLSERILLASNRSWLGFDPFWDTSWNLPGVLASFHIQLGHLYSASVHIVHCTVLV